MTKIVIDNAIPFVNGVFEPYADVIYKEGREICHEDLVDADALVIRTRTRCDEQLLAGTNVKLIATNTIGTENVDSEYCKNAGIFLQNAAGSTAGAVMNYVFSALYGVASRKAIKLSGATLGIVGVGMVGSRVERMALALGFKILRYDPWREAAEGPSQFCSLDELLENSNVVTLHMPLNDSTRGLAGEEFFSKMRPGTVFINTSKGELVDEDALKKALPMLGAVIIDVWNNEPNIDLDLLDMVDIATPHISGYSYQSKQRASAAAVRSVARFFGFEELYGFFPETDVKDLEAVRLEFAGKTQGQIASLFQYNYPVFTDDFMLRMNPGDFERIRSEYRYRREFFAD